MASLSGAERQRYVARLFSRIAGQYDLMNDLMTMGMHRRWKRKTAALATRSTPGAALDVSTGTGDLALALAQRESVSSAVALDLLPEMIEQAQAKTHRRGYDRVSFLVGDALSLPFATNTFACATAAFSLRNMPDVQQALAEMVRVIRPGGRVALLELSPMPDGVKSRLFRVYFHGLVPLVGSLVAGDRAAYTYLPKSVDVFHSAEQLADILRSCGLTGVGYQRLGFGTVCIHYGVKPDKGTSTRDCCGSHTRSAPC